MHSIYVIDIVEYDDKYGISLRVSTHALLKILISDVSIVWFVEEILGNSSV